MHAIAVAVVLAANFAVPLDAAARDTSTVEKALLGHWRTEDGKTDYYFGPRTLIMVDNGRRQDQRWEAVLRDPPRRRIDVQITVVDTGKGHTKKIIFAPDYRSIDESITIQSITIPGRWLWVDARQSP